MKSILIFLILLPITSFAKPLGTIPTIEENRRRIIIEGRSDLWLEMNSDKETPIRISNFELLSPLARHEDWVGSINIQSEALNLNRNDLLIGKNQVSLGSDLRSDYIGVFVSKSSGNERSFSFYAAYMSASDKPFANNKDIWPELTAVYQSALANNWQWITLLNYSKNRGFLNDSVLPYVGLRYLPGSDLSISFGFPFFHLLWGFEPLWNMSFVATPVGAEIAIHHQSTDALDMYVKAGLSARSYLHVNRVKDDRRVVYEEKFIETGVKLQVTDQTLMKFSVGGSFERAAYEARNVFAAQGSKTGFNADIMGLLGLEFLL